jgi:hypothetical protein
VKRVFVKVLAFLIDYSIWIATLVFIVTLSLSTANRNRTIELEAQKIDEIYEAVSEVCELGGNVWSWEDKSCYSPSRMQKIHRHRPTSKGLL